MKPILKFNLKLLQLFRLVAEHGSFRQAADRTNRSQSAISTQIRQLEAQLGVTLFERTTRRVQLTSSGEQLLHCVKRAFEELDIGLQQIERAVELKRGRVSISCSPTIAVSRLPIILSNFTKSHPGVKVFVQELTSDDLYESLRNHEVDFGIGPATISADFRCEPVLSEDIYALVAPVLLRTNKLSITLSQLTKLPLLLLHPATALRAQFEDAARHAELNIRMECQFSQAQSLIGAAAAGLGVAILPKIALPRKASHQMQVLRITEPIITRQIALITLRKQTLSPAANRLAQLVKDLIEPDGSAD